jgi:hypothetical protein
VSIVISLMLAYRPQLGMVVALTAFGSISCAVNHSTSPLTSTRPDRSSSSVIPFWMNTVMLHR